MGVKASGMTAVASLAVAWGVMYEEGLLSLLSWRCAACSGYCVRRYTLSTPPTLRPRYGLFSSVAAYAPC